MFWWNPEDLAESQAAMWQGPSNEDSNQNPTNIIPRRERAGYWAAVRSAGSIRDHRATTSVVVCAIIAAAVLAGAEVENPGNGVTKYGEPIVLAIFVAELVLKVFAEGTRPWNYLRRKINVFDLPIVVVCFLSLSWADHAGNEQGAGSAVGQIRLLRLARLFRLFDQLPGLAIMWQGLTASVVSIFYISVLLVLVFYVSLVPYFLPGE